ncbi:MAG: patatin-like phospholipase family protein [Proteobacteria bacterium]|nr:patatin-like phospholipase family protein [Pseudomonadota bacterium]
MKRIGLALGGGGARGLAHIVMLEAFDELGVRPHRLAGTSVGAIVAAAYASGQSGRDIRARFARMLLAPGDSFWQTLGRRDLRRWFGVAQFNLGRGALMKGDSLRQILLEEQVAADFASLVIPLKLVAADYWNWGQVVLDRGDLPLAVQASVAVPGIFQPVPLGGRVLVDGGAVNPVPYDLWDDETDIRIGIDVLGQRGAGRNAVPGLFEAVFNTVQIMENSILSAKLRHDPPDLLIRPQIEGVRMFEFYKADAIYRSAGRAKDQLKRQLDTLLAPD